MAKGEYSAVGRRKKAVARVRLVSGDGKIVINKRDIDNYFGLETLKMTVRQPLNLTNVGNFDVIVLRAVPKDRRSRFQIRHLNIRDKTPFKARGKPLLQRLDLLRRTVRADDDLLARVVQRIERVEELLLHRLLARDELDIVDHQKIHVAVALPEFDVFAGS